MIVEQKHDSILIKSYFFEWMIITFRFTFFPCHHITLLIIPHFPIFEN